MVRPSVDEWALGVAKAVATRGECSRRLVGAVILDPHKRIVSCGYNGSPPGEPSCLDGTCPRARNENVVPLRGYAESGCVVTHAEENAITEAGRPRCRGCTIYVTCEPCEMCYPRIRGAGIIRAVWPGGEWNFR